MIKDGKTWKLKTSCAVKVDEKIWFSNFHFNGLFYFDIKTSKAKFVSFFPDENLDVSHMHNCVLNHGDLLIFAPWCSEHLHIYSIEKKEFVTIHIEKTHAESIAEIFIYDNYVYIIPLYPNHNFLKVDLDRFEVIVLDDISEEEKKYSTGKAVRSEKMAYWKDSIWYVYQEDGALYRWCLKNDELTEYKREGLFSDVFCSEMGVLITERYSNRLLLFDGQEFDIISDGNGTLTPVSVYKFPYSIATTIKDMTLIFSRNLEFCLEIENTKKCRVITNDFGINRDVKVDKGSLAHSESCVKVGNEIWLLPLMGENIIVFDKELKKIGEKTMAIDESDYKKIWEKMLSYGQIILREGDGLSLEVFFKNITETR